MPKDVCTLVRRIKPALVHSRPTPQKDHIQINHPISLGLMSELSKVTEAKGCEAKIRKR